MNHKLREAQEKRTGGFFFRAGVSFVYDGKVENNAACIQESAFFRFCPVSTTNSKNEIFILS